MLEVGEDGEKKITKCNAIISLSLTRAGAGTYNTKKGIQHMEKHHPESVAVQSSNLAVQRVKGGVAEMLTTEGPLPFDHASRTDTSESLSAFFGI